MNTRSQSSPMPLILNWQTELTLTKKITLALIMACLTGLMAQVRVPLPFTPVPMTGQTFAVLMAGVVLGKNWGGISQIIYATLGFVGVPWFSGMSGGLAVLMGPTGGYILGFILAALFIGYMIEKSKGSKNFFFLLLVMSFGTFALIFIPGLVHLALWTSLVKGSEVRLMEILAMGFFPFVIGGVIKIFLAAGITAGLNGLQGHLDRQ